MKTKLSTALIGAVMATLSVPALYAAPPAQPPPARAAASQAGPTELKHMEARMRLLHEQMRRIRATKSRAERSKLLREHMITMLEQMRAMRAFGGGMMSGMMGRGMGGGMMGRGRMSGGMMGEGMMGGGNANATPSERRQWMQDRLDMMQMMMEQMMGQMQEMDGMGGHMDTHLK